MSELPLQAYYDLTQIGEIAVSPSGDRVAFTATEYDQDDDDAVASLFVAPTDGSRDPHRLTSAAGASSPQWGPDGDRLAFVAARDEDVERRVGWQDRDDGEEADDDEDGSDDEEAAPAGADDDGPKPQVWLHDLALGGDARQVTDREEGVSEFDWSPDGDRLVVAARDPTDDEAEYLDRRREGGPVEVTRMQHKLDGVGWLDDVTTYLFVVDLEAALAGDDDAARRLDDAYGGGAFQDLSGLEPAWGPGGIAFTSCRLPDPDDTTVRDVYTVDPAGGEATKWTDGDRSCGAPAWSDDGTLAFVAGDNENWCKPDELYLAEEPGAFESVTAALDRTIARGGAPHWVDGAVYTRIADHSRTRLIRADRDGVDRLFEAQGNRRSVAGFDIDAAGETATLVLSDPSDGTDVFAVDAADLDDADAPGAHRPAEAPETFPDDPASLTRVSKVNGALVEEYPMPEARRVEWESDGREIDGVVYHDPDVDPANGPHPVVVAIHGGPISYDEPVFGFSHAALTSRGYVIFRPNYRGGSSRGREFAETLRGRWGTAEVDDIAAGVRSLVDRGWADPDRVFGYGFSYGGIAQGFLVTREPELFTAAAPEHGIYDLRSAFGTDDSHNWMENEYGLPWDNPEAIDASSSILEAGNIETPLLVTAGGEDWRCPPSQSEQLYLAAQKAGVDAKLVVYPDEHHNIGDPDRAIHRLEELTDWYEKHDPAVENGD